MLPIFADKWSTLQRTNTENWNKYFHIYVSCERFTVHIPTIDLPILLQEICGSIPGIYKSLTDINVEIGTEAAQFPEKEYINGVFVAVQFEKRRHQHVGTFEFIELHTLH